MKIAVLACVALTGCGFAAAERARDPFNHMTGMGWPDLMACAGDPTIVRKIAPDRAIAEWDYHADGVKVFSAAVPVVGGLDIGSGAKACKMVATVLDDGTVVQFNFPGRDTGLTTPPYAGCEVLARECVEHASDTGLPAGYRAFDFMPFKKD